MSECSEHGATFRFRWAHLPAALASFALWGLIIWGIVAAANLGGF